MLSEFRSRAVFSVEQKNNGFPIENGRGRTKQNKLGENQNYKAEKSAVLSDNEFQTTPYQ
jgi:hypothetical protein